ncbi:hypothetical protein LTR37_011704 [Vermiconidia calcicola]|uniref:Uncharacterized protein n=1 Tax=Vermiconidia calcicola TaxID=1690605 RepID=A0ACC3N1F5_9PEZI|nr:hypothetical protein LTR37_011704 [Vermiconidia calcicola]
MRVRTAVQGALCGALFAAQSASGLQLDISSANSIKQAAKTIANGMLNYYNGEDPGGIPGLLPPPYYWWEAGAMFGSLIDYWYYTGDDTFNRVTTDGILFQVGPDYNFMPPNQSKSLGNDDQAFWGLAAMSAAEVKFPNPPEDQPQWLALAQAVFNSQALRWNTEACGGGLKWQIYSFNVGYNYRNTISNGCFFNLAARLGAYTQNETFFRWAERSWDWVVEPSIGLVADNYRVYDGTHDTANCTNLVRVQWSYNAGVYLLGAATMWNQTTGADQEMWRARVQGLLDATIVFFYKGTNVMFEVACEPRGNCNVDQRSFKAYLGRWMAATTKVAPWTHDTIMPFLQQSATAAATSCSGGDSGTECGMRWTTGNWDGQLGVGEQMSALEVIQSNLIDNVQGPVSNSTGGISTGDSNAGTTGDDLIYTAPITTGDRAGAGIITAMLLVFIVGGAWWMVR